MSLTDDELAALPVFPLPGAVLFPGTTLGLHLFEPRYRAMMQHCLDHGPRAMAIAQLVPGHENDYRGQPPIFDVAGAGRIAAHRANADGTFDIALTCVARVRLVELPFVAPFRRARGEVLIETTADAADLRRLAEVASRLRASAPDEGEVPPEHMVDVLADAVVREPAQRQRLLEMLDADARLEEVMRLLVAADVRHRDTN